MSLIQLSLFVAFAVVCCVPSANAQLDLPSIDEITANIPSTDAIQASITNSINNFSLKDFIMNYVKTHYPKIKPELLNDPAFLKDLGYDELLNGVKGAFMGITECWANEIPPVKKEFAAFFHNYAAVLVKQFS